MVLYGKKESYQERLCLCAIRKIDALEHDIQYCPFFSNERNLWISPCTCGQVSAPVKEKGGPLWAGVGWEVTLVAAKGFLHVLQ